MLELKNITKTYTPKKGVPVQALRGVDLSFEDRGMVFILGKSGSGKSTLLNIIGGLDSADGGEIIIDGKSTKGFKESDYDNYRNTYVGFVFQEYNILNDFTVGENISLAVELQNGKVSKERVDEILKEVGLEGYADRKPNELSGGQKQRVAIARALIKTPEIIMADEPTGALDSETGRSIFELLKKLSEDKLVVVVSHDREFAEEYGDRIIELSDGEVIADKVNREIKGERKEREDKEIKKARLPYKRALAMGAKSLTKKRLRLAITIILCFVSFAAFGFADVAANYNNHDAVADALYQSGDNYVSFKASMPRLSGYSYYHNEISPSYQDLERITEKTGLNFQGAIERQKLPVMDESLLTLNNEYYYQGIYRLLPASQELFDAMGFKLYGRLPKDENEIIITKYHYDQFSIAGIKLKGNNDYILPEEIGDIESFVGENINISPGTIVGVLDTYADADGKWSWIKSYQGTLDYYYEQICKQYFTDSYHSIIFVDQTKYDKELAKYPKEDLSGFGRTIKTNISNNIIVNGVANDSALNKTQEIIWLDGKGSRKELAANEIVIGAGAAEYLWPASDYQVEKNMKCYYAENYIDGIISFDNMNLYVFRSIGAEFIAYCQEAEKISQQELNSYKAYCFSKGRAFGITDVDNNLNFQVSLSDNSFNNNVYFNLNGMDEKQWRLSYACYLGTKEILSENIIEGGYYNNVTGRQSGELIKEKYRDIIFTKNRIENALSSMVKINPNNYSIYYAGKPATITFESAFNEAPTIVGIYIPQNDYPADFAINNILYTDSLNFENEIFEFLIAPINMDREMADRIADITCNMDTQRGFVSKNIAFYSVDSEHYIFNILHHYLMWGSLIVGLFSVLLLASYFAVNISSRKKEIGILRAMGAKKSDIIAIFINESIIILSIILLLAVIGIAFTCLGVNCQILIKYGFKVTMLKLGFRQIMLMVGVGAAATVFASAIPLYKMAKKKPVDIIQNK